MNNLDPEVAERPDDLVVYGGSGKAARSWEAFDAIVASLQRARARRDAARAVGQAGRRLPHARRRAARAHRQRAARAGAGRPGRTSATSKHRGLTMYGQMTAGSWIYIGTQGILQGTYETLAAAGAAAFRRHAARPARRHRRPRRHGRRPAAGRDDERRASRSSSRSIRSGSSGAWRRGTSTRRPTASTRRWRASARWTRASDARARSALRGNAADVLPALVARGVTPDVVTDQTSAHDALNGYVPDGLSLDEARARCASAIPTSTSRARCAAMAAHVRAMLDAAARAARSTFDYGNNIRAQAQQAGVADAFDIPGFVPEYIRPLFCEGKGPFRWAALSGDPDDIRVTDDAALELFPHDEALAPLDSRWRASASRSRGCRRASAGSATASARRFGLRINELVRERRDQGADRDRPRSSRHRIGRVAEPRDRRHARRQRRDRRLADPERAAQRVERRDLGVGPPRRRRRHRLLAARRHGDRRRRHAPTPTSGSSAC